VPPEQLTAALRSLSVADVGAPKRKAGGGGHQGHHGLASDSSQAVWLVALSRLLRLRDETLLGAAAASPVGAAVVNALLPVVLRVALAEGGAESTLNAGNLLTLFNLSASHAASQRLYEGGLSLPSRLPWESAVALLAAFFHSLSAARKEAEGNQLAELLLRVPSPPLDAQGQALVQSVAAAVEASMRAALSGGGGGGSSGGGGGSSGGAGGSSASARSARSSSPPSAAGDAPPALPPLPAPPFAIDPTTPLAANAHRLVEARLGRRLSAAELIAVDSALNEGLSLLQAGDAAARQQLLATPVLAALAVPSAAQLWASLLEVAEGSVLSAQAVTSALIDACSAVAGTLFAAALGV